MAQARVLVVDDERSMQEFLEIFLRSEGYEAATAGNLANALIQIEGGEFDVIVTDIQMPDGSGLDLLRAVQKHAPETVVVMMTAYASIERTRSRRSSNAFARAAMKSCGPDSAATTAAWLTDEGPEVA